MRLVLLIAALIFSMTAAAEPTIKVTRPSEQLFKFEICENGNCRPVVGETGVFRFADVQALITKKIPLTADATWRQTSWIGTVLVGVGAFSSGMSLAFIWTVHNQGLSIVPLLSLPVYGIAFISMGGAFLTRARLAARERLAASPEGRQLCRLKAAFCSGDLGVPVADMSMDELAQNLAMDLSPLRSLTTCELELALASDDKSSRF